MLVSHFLCNRLFFNFAALSHNTLTLNKTNTAVSKNKETKVIAKKQVQVKGKFPEKIGDVEIPKASLLLCLLSILMYIPSFKLGITDLDDKIFTVDFAKYYQDWGNMAHSFSRGLFNPTGDPYYRPIFLDFMQLNYRLFGEGIFSYHIINILLHAGSVVLLFQLLQLLNTKQAHAFVLAGLFAIHPALVQAVSWVPGRNDTLLAIFAYSYLIFTIKYAAGRNVLHLGLAALFLLLALFTKETAVFMPIVALLLLLMVVNKSIKDVAVWLTAALGLVMIAVWYLARAQAAPAAAALSGGEMVSTAIARSPVLLQYFGKAIVPYGLSVFPTQKDTSLVYGGIAVALILISLLLTKKTNRPRIFAGLIIFVLLLLPALLVPSSLNEQMYEHRLYLPMLGVLLIVPELGMVKNSIDSNVIMYGALIAILYLFANVNHQKNFKDPLTFWTSAVATTPHSAYANMMLAARTDNIEDANVLIRKAYQLDPNQKYIGYYYGKMLQMKDSVLQSEPYLLKEKMRSGYYECDFYLARVAIEKKDTISAMEYLQNYLRVDPANPSANNNLLLMLVSLNKKEAAQQQIDAMRKMGLEVAPQILDMLAHPAAKPAAPTAQPDSLNKNAKK